ncbi:peroxiredoxin-like family protein [Salipaludibacillus sp. HK11]|uniref:peroxiredoxin-like family protein n=1 Tax=Salipaludibacillus sp. HK11 TaxID=3394320 RepID=UPI0039FBFBBE
MREREDEIVNKGVQIIVIAPSKGSFINQFLDAFGPFPFPIYGDPKRQAYRGMGHETMPKLKLLAMASLGILTGKVKDFLPKEASEKSFVKKSMKTQDVYIQGGTWLFDENSKIVWKHVDKSPDDHATIDEIKGKLEKLPKA